MADWLHAIYNATLGTNPPKKSYTQYLMDYTHHNLLHPTTVLYNINTTEPHYNRLIEPSIKEESSWKDNQAIFSLTGVHKMHKN